jgi:hypothetical protein
MASSPPPEGVGGGPTAPPAGWVTAGIDSVAGPVVQMNTASRKARLARSLACGAAAT